MLKILQARLQQCVNCELADVQAGFRTGRRTRDQIRSWKKQESFRKTSISALTMLKPLTVWTTTNCGNSSRDGNTRPPYLLRNLCTGQEATVRTGHGTTDWFQVGK